MIQHRHDETLERLTRVRQSGDPEQIRAMMGDVDTWFAAETDEGMRAAYQQMYVLLLDSWMALCQPTIGAK